LRLLLIEDSPLVQTAFLHLIRGVHPYALTNVVDNAPEAVALLDKCAYDYIVSDFDLRIGTGGDVLQHVREHFAFYIACNRFILMSGDLRPSITGLKHPLTFEKPVMLQQIRALLTGGLLPEAAGDKPYNPGVP
jgi:CheY-like chemotaxis protein